MAYEITKKMVEIAWEKKNLKLITDPRNKEIACQIGDAWVHIDDSDNRFLTVDEYLNKVADEEIVSRIFRELNEMKSLPDSKYIYIDLCYYFQEHGIRPQIYKIPVAWECYGYLEIEADSIDEAISKAWMDDGPLPKGEYLDGSWDVDEEAAYEVNNCCLQEE